MTETKKMKREIEGNHFSEAVQVGGTDFVIGHGGLHSVDAAGLWEADANHRIFDMDMRSCYPSVIEIHKLAPSHLPERPFLTAFSSLKRRRLQAKDAGRTTLADGLKISINALFGKTGSAYGWLTDPTALIRCTVMGQLTLLTFVDLLQVEGVDIVSANTDGITFRVRRNIADLVSEACNDLAKQMGYELDWAEFIKIARRDINNYIAVYAGGGVKAKGAYRYDPKELGKKATNRICIDAAVAHLCDPSVSIEEVIKANRDVGKIIDYFKCQRGYHISASDGTEYGRIARWYIAECGVHLDKVKQDGKRIQLVEAGAKIVNILPDEYPDDVDTAHYIARAQALVDAILNPEVKHSTTIPRAEWSKAQIEQHEINYACTEPDLYRCRGVELPHEAWTARVHGSGYDTMKRLLVRLWLSYGGLMTRGDLMWCAQELDAADGYFRTPTMRRTLKKMVEWVARDVAPFPLPRTVDEQIDRAWTWAAENVEPLKRQKKNLMHRDCMGSDYLSGQTISRWDRMRDTYKLICAICAVLFKNGHDRDDALIKRIVSDVEDYFSKKATIND